MKTIIKAEENKTIPLSDFLDLNKCISPLVGLEIKDKNYTDRKYILTPTRNGHIGFTDGFRFIFVDNNIRNLFNEILQQSTYQLFHFENLNEMAKWITEDK